MLQISKDVPNFKADPNGVAQTIPSVRFFSQCVRLNKPCIFEALAKSWPAFQSWRTNKVDNSTGTAYLEELLGAEQEVRAFRNPPASAFLQEGYSFKRANELLLKYGDFVKQVKDESEPGLVVIKDSRRKSKGEGGHAEVGDLELKKLMDDITMPDFYKDISELEGIDFMQGSYMIEKPHYEKREQLMCLVDGRMDIKLVPHFNR